MYEPLDDSKKVKSAAGAPEIVELGPVPEGLIWELFHVAVEDETTAFTKVRVGIGQANDFRPLEEQDPGVAAELYTAHDTIMVPEGKFLRAEFTGTTSGDKLALYMNGRSVRKE